MQTATALTATHFVGPNLETATLYAQDNGQWMRLDPIKGWVSTDQDPTKMRNGGVIKKG